MEWLTGLLLVLVLCLFVSVRSAIRDVGTRHTAAHVQLLRVCIGVQRDLSAGSKAEVGLSDEERVQALRYKIGKLEEQVTQVQASGLQVRSELRSVYACIEELFGTLPMHAQQAREVLASADPGAE